MRGWIFDQHGPITLKKNKRLPRIELDYRLSGVCVSYRNPATLTYLPHTHRLSSCFHAPPLQERILGLADGGLFSAIGKQQPGRYRSLSVSVFPTHAIRF